MHSMIGKHRAILAAVCALALVTLAAAQVWDTKDSSTWSDKEIKQILDNSPWVGETGISRADIRLIGSGPAGNRQEGSHRLTYQVTLRSAAPVRQALVRRALADRSVEKYSEEQRKQHAEYWNNYLTEPMDDKIVVAVRYHGNPPQIPHNVALYWEIQNLENLRDIVYLQNERGERMAPVHWEAAPRGMNEMEFTFPRKKENGEPFVRESDSKLEVNFYSLGLDPPRGLGQGGLLPRDLHPKSTNLVQLMTVKFNLKKMRFRNSLQY